MNKWRGVFFVLLVGLLVGGWGVWHFFYRPAVEHASARSVRLMDPVVRHLALTATTTLVVGGIFCILVIAAMVLVWRKGSRQK